MHKKRILFISFVTVIFIAIYQHYALKYSWFWTYKWSDIPIHIAGGFWVALTTLWICLKVKHIDNIYGYKKKSIFAMLISVLIIAILWEIFELIFRITSLADAGYWRDNLLDILNSFIGGVIALVYFLKNKKTTSHVVDLNIKSSLGIVI